MLFQLSFHVPNPEPAQPERETKRLTLNKNFKGGGVKGIFSFSQHISFPHNTLL